MSYRNNYFICWCQSCVVNVWAKLFVYAFFFILTPGIQDLKNDGIIVEKLHLDNDATTLARAKQSFPNISKRPDKNHTKKGIANFLYESSKKHVILKNQEFTSYIIRCIMYAVEQNKGNATQISSSLRQIVPHMFGDHENCDTKWCSHKENQETAVYKSIPGGKALTDDALRETLQELIDGLGAKSEMLSNLGTTQANENFNNIVATKAPKNR